MATDDTKQYKDLNKWQKRFLSLAEHISAWSKDPSTKCGAVITKGNCIISLGFNGFPMEVDDHSSRYTDRELKYQMIIHAEINAILFAKESLDGCTLYTTPLPPCCRCAAQVIQSGITHIVAPQCTTDLGERWEESLEIAKQMYIDAGVTLTEVALLNNSMQENHPTCRHIHTREDVMNRLILCNDCNMKKDYFDGEWK